MAERERTGSVSRRAFISGAAAGIAVAAGVSAQEEAPEAWDAETDLVVVGSGTSLTGALAAAAAGARVLVLEKQPGPGGTTAISGGVAWIPNNHVLHAAGIQDSREGALTYLRRLSLGQADEELLEAFVDRGPEMARFVERHSDIRFRLGRLNDPVHDYHPEWPGAVVKGRSIEPDEPGLRHYGSDLVGGLLAGVRRAGGELWLESPARELIARRREDGSSEVLGVVAERAGRPLRVRARRGVLLAAGGFDHDPEMARHFLRGPSPYPLGTPGLTGDGIRMAMQLGADLRNMNECWSITVYRADGEAGQASLNAQIEKSAPGCIAVNRFGERFSNESADYDSTWRAYLAGDNWGEIGYRNLPAWQISDSKARRDRTLGGQTAGQPLPDWFARADSLRGLARKLGIDPDGLERTVTEFNRHARQGRDPLFRRGESVYDHMTRGVEATLAPLNEPPFYGAEVSPAHLGTCGGPRVNAQAQVIDVGGRPIERLYASGNNAGVGGPGAGYGGGGGTIGPAMTFAYIAGTHAAGLSPWEA